MRKQPAQPTVFNHTAKVVVKEVVAGSIAQVIVEEVVSGGRSHLFFGASFVFNFFMLNLPKTHSRPLLCSECL